MGSIGNYYASSGTAAAVNVGGNLSAGGAVTLKLGGAGPAVLGGNYQVLGYGGSLLGAGSNSFALNTAGISLPTNGSLALVYGTSAVDVSLSVSNYPIWSGTSSSTWAGTNWQSSSSSLATTFANGNMAYFGDYYPTTGGTVAVSTLGISFSSQVTPYSAVLRQHNQVVYVFDVHGNRRHHWQCNAGNDRRRALTINNSNTYTGGTLLYNGTLNLGNSAALGGAGSTLTLAGGTLDNTSGGAMTLAQNYPMTWSNNFGFNGTNALNLGTGAVTLSGSSSNIAINVSASTLTVGGAISGPYGLTQTGAGTLLLNGADTFTGSTLVNGGVLTINNATALQNSTLDFSGGGTVGFGVAATTVGGLTNGGALALTNSAGAAVTLTVGNNGQTNTFSGNISGLGSITKNGAGLLALSGNLTYGGSTNVSAGTLQFVGNLPPSGSAVGMGGGTLSIANDNATSGTISAGNNITMTAGATVGIDTRALTGTNPNSVVSFGVLSNGTSANALASTFNLTGANGYTQSLHRTELAGFHRTKHYAEANDDHGGDQRPGQQPVDRRHRRPLRHAVPPRQQHRQRDKRCDFGLL